MTENVLNLTDFTGRGLRLMGNHRFGLQLIGRRRGRRLEEEAAEVAEIDRWLTEIRNQPEMVLYPLHPAPAAPAHATSTNSRRTARPSGRARSKKRRR